MPRLIEKQHPGESWLLHKIGNWTTIDRAYVRSIAVAWLFKENGRWVFVPRLCGSRSLFFNAVLFLRVSLPFGLFWSVRWSPRGTRAFWQTGFGWKLNGRLAILFRVSSDEAAAKGVTGPNHGQAKGFEYGTH